MYISSLSFLDSKSGVIGSIVGSCIGIAVVILSIVAILIVTIFAYNKLKTKKNDNITVKVP